MALMLCRAVLCHAVLCHAVQVLGAKRKTLTGYSSSTVQPHQGFIYSSALIQATPPGTGGHGFLIRGLVTSGYLHRWAVLSTKFWTHQAVNNSSGCCAVSPYLTSLFTIHCAALLLPCSCAALQA